MRVILVRHAESKDNRLGLLAGSKESGLTQLGKDQAARLGMRLKDERIGICYMSDLPRAKETAEAIVAHHPAAEVHADQRLREQRLGIFEGRPWEEYQETERRSGLPKRDFVPPGGESVGQMQERVTTAFDGIVAASAENTVLIVTHNGPIKAMVRHVTGNSLLLKGESLKNASVTIIETDEDGMITMPALSDTAHLA
ncbi:histidine phosphatase family protein [Candidatus Woesearchaeota archaeon]|nr:histidine phosphatase family protein [Candidatus Woesearchaeota archaeon]